MIKAPIYFAKSLILNSKRIRNQAFIVVLLESYSVKTKDIVVLTNKALEKQSNIASRVEIEDKEELIERSSINHRVYHIL
jgi:hypothetical protein